MFFGVLKETRSVFCVIIFLGIVNSCIVEEPQEGYDLFISKATFPVEMDVTAPNPVVPYTVDYTVKNRGTKDYTGTLNVQIWVSPTYYVSSESLLLATDTITGGIQAGKSASSSIATDSAALLLLASLPTNPAYIIIDIPAGSDIDKYNNIASSEKITVTGGLIPRVTIMPNGVTSEYIIGAGQTQYFKFMTTPGHAYELEWSDNLSKPILVTAGSEDGLISYLSKDDASVGLPFYVSAPPAVGGVNQYMYINIESTLAAGAYTFRVGDLGAVYDLSVAMTAQDNSDYKSGGPAGTNPWNATGSPTGLTVTYSIDNLSAIDPSGEVCFWVGFWVNRGSLPSFKMVADFEQQVCMTPVRNAQVLQTYLLSGVTTASNVSIYIDYYNEIPESDETNNAIALPAL